MSERDEQAIDPDAEVLAAMSRESFMAGPEAHSAVYVHNAAIVATRLRAEAVDRATAHLRAEAIVTARERDAALARVGELEQRLATAETVISFARTVRRWTSEPRPPGRVRTTDSAFGALSDALDDYDAALGASDPVPADPSSTLQPMADPYEVARQIREHSAHTPNDAADPVPAQDEPRPDESVDRCRWCSEPIEYRSWGLMFRWLHIRPGYSLCCVGRDGNTHDAAPDPAGAAPEQPDPEREAPADEEQDELLSTHIPSAVPRLDTHDTWEPCPSEQVTILGSAEGYAWVRCKRRKGHTLPHKFEMTWSESVSAETAARYPKRPGGWQGDSLAVHLADVNTAAEQPDTPQPAPRGCHAHCWGDSCPNRACDCACHRGPSSEAPEPPACDDCGEHHEGYGECSAARAPEDEQ